MKTILNSERLEKLITSLQTGLMIAAVPVLFVMCMMHGGNKIEKKEEVSRSIEMKNSAPSQAEEVVFYTIPSPVTSL
jgi:hypothetical protein